MAERTLQMGLRILRCRDFPGLSSWVQGDHKSAYKREAEWSESESSLCGLKSTQVMMEEVIGTVATELVSCSPVTTRLHGQEEGCLFPICDHCYFQHTTSCYTSLSLCHSSLFKFLNSSSVRTFSSFSLPDQNDWLGKLAVFKTKPTSGSSLNINGCLPLKKALGYRIRSHILPNHLWLWILNYLGDSCEPQFLPEWSLRKSVMCVPSSFRLEAHGHWRGVQTVALVSEKPWGPVLAVLGPDLGPRTSPALPAHGASHLSAPPHPSTPPWLCSCRRSRSAGLSPVSAGSAGSLRFLGTRCLLPAPGTLVGRKGSPPFQLLFINIRLLTCLCPIRLESQTRALPSSFTVPPAPATVAPWEVGSGP